MLTVNFFISYKSYDSICYGISEKITNEQQIYLNNLQDFLENKTITQLRYFTNSAVSFISLIEDYFNYSITDSKDLKRYLSNSNSISNENFYLDKISPFDFERVKQNIYIINKFNNQYEEFKFIEISYNEEKP